MQHLKVATENLGLEWSYKRKSRMFPLIYLGDVKQISHGHSAHSFTVWMLRDDEIYRRCLFSQNIIATPENGRPHSNKPANAHYLHLPACEAVSSEQYFSWLRDQLPCWLIGIQS